MAFGAGQAATSCADAHAKCVNHCSNELSQCKARGVDRGTCQKNFDRCKADCDKKKTECEGKQNGANKTAPKKEAPKKSDPKKTDAKTK